MNDNPQYSDVAARRVRLSRSAHRRLRGGRHSARASSSSIPASASASTCTTTWRCWRALSLYHALGVPVLLGASRKKLHRPHFRRPQSARPRAGLASPPRSPAPRRACRSCACTTSPRPARRSTSGGRPWPAPTRFSPDASRQLPGFGFLGVMRVSLATGLDGPFDPRCRNTAAAGTLAMLASGRCDQSSLCKQTPGTVSAKLQQRSSGDSHVAPLFRYGRHSRSRQQVADDLGGGAEGRHGRRQDLPERQRLPPPRGDRQGHAAVRLHARGGADVGLHLRRHGRVPARPDADARPSPC